MSDEDSSNSSGSGSRGFPLFFARQNSNNKGRSLARPTVGLGWQPDLPDVRDYNLKNEKLKETLAKANLDLIIDPNATLPSKIDHQKGCSPIEDQQELGSCTAQSVVGLMEFMIRKAYGEHFDGSRLFVYKVTRHLMGTTDDSGAFLRTTMQAVSLFGIPPERHCPYIIENYNDEPSAFLYSYASNYQSLNYARLDPPESSPIENLEMLKRVLASGFCAVLGFSVFSSLTNAADIPFPKQGDSHEGGHAVMVVGYDDNHTVDGVKTPSLIIRNSWGASWGEEGYGYLPYQYILKGLARDIWTSFKWEWISEEKFGD